MSPWIQTCQLCPVIPEQRLHLNSLSSDQLERNYTWKTHQCTHSRILLSYLLTLSPYISKYFIGSLNSSQKPPPHKYNSVLQGTDSRTIYDIESYAL